MQKQKVASKNFCWGYSLKNLTKALAGKTFEYEREYPIRVTLTRKLKGQTIKIEERVLRIYLQSAHENLKLNLWNVKEKRKLTWEAKIFELK